MCGMCGYVVCVGVWYVWVCGMSWMEVDNGFADFQVPAVAVSWCCAVHWPMAGCLQAGGPLRQGCLELLPVPTRVRVPAQKKAAL